MNLQCSCWICTNTLLSGFHWFSEWMVILNVRHQSKGDALYYGQGKSWIMLIIIGHLVSCFLSLTLTNRCENNYEKWIMFYTLWANTVEETTVWVFFATLQISLKHLDSISSLCLLSSLCVFAYIKKKIKN